MSVTILEVLENAKYNLVTNSAVPIAKKIGETQLTNAIALLEKGYNVNEDFDTVMGEHENAGDVPEKEIIER